MGGLENYVRNLLGALDARHHLTMYVSDGQAARIRAFAPRSDLDTVEDQRIGFSIADRLDPDAQDVLFCPTAFLDPQDPPLPCAVELNDPLHELLPEGRRPRPHRSGGDGVAGRSRAGTRAGTRAPRADTRFHRAPVLAEVLRGARALLFPSRFEGFGDAELLVEPGDAAGLTAALARVLDDGGVAQDLVTRGRRRTSAHEWSRVVENVERELQRVAISD